MPQSAVNTVPLTRRGVLEIGYSSLLGAGLSALISERSPAAESGLVARAKSVLFLFLGGGPSHVDTFDLKPEAPDECRGEFHPIDTVVSGVQICEHLPQLAQQMNQWALIRSMTCNQAFGDHRFAVHGLLGGVDELPPGANLSASRRDWPSWCAGAEYFRKGIDGLPTSVVLPNELADPGTGVYPGQNAGLLGAKYDPFQIRCNPADPKYRADDSLRLPAGMTIERLASKRSLLTSLDRQQAYLESTLQTLPYDQSRQEAFQVLTSGRLAQALAIEDESATNRDRYGRHVFGQSMLMARRLIEAGVPIVQANIGHLDWDTHYNSFTALRTLLPPFDRAVSALMNDLRTSGLLDQTLVVMMGEFGRTPKLVIPGGSMPNFTSAGRDHWMTCFSGFLAGAGVRGGQVIGRSDAIGAHPVTHPYRHSDVAATVYSALGINPAAEIVDIQGRPLRLNHGQVIDALYTAREG
jgi:hypothetical protein